MPTNLESSAVATEPEQVCFHSNPKERQCQKMFKLPHNSIHLHASQLMFKILQAMFQYYINQELPDVRAGFINGRGTRNQIANICWIIKKCKRVPRKTSTSDLLTMPKPLTIQITINCGKFFKRWEYQITLPASWEICIHIKKQQLEPDTEQWPISKLG